MTKVEWNVDGEVLLWMGLYCHEAVHEHLLSCITVRAMLFNRLGRSLPQIFQDCLFDMALC